MWAKDFTAIKTVVNVHKSGELSPQETSQKNPTENKIWKTKWLNRYPHRLVSINHQVTYGTKTTMKQPCDITHTRVTVLAGVQPTLHPHSLCPAKSPRPFLGVRITPHARPTLSSQGRHKKYKWKKHRFALSLSGNPELLEYEQIPDHQDRKLRKKTRKDWGERLWDNGSEIQKLEAGDPCSQFHNPPQINSAVNHITERGKKS